MIRLPPETRAAVFIAQVVILIFQIGLHYRLQQQPLFFKIRFRLHWRQLNHFSEIQTYLGKWLGHHEFVPAVKVLCLLGLDK